MTDPAEHLLPLRDVMTRLGIGRSSVYRLVEVGKLSPPCKPTPRKACWPASEVDALVAQIIMARDRQPKAQKPVVLSATSAAKIVSFKK